MREQGKKMPGIKIEGFTELNESLRGLINTKQQSYYVNQLVMAIADKIKEFAPRDTRESHARRHQNIGHLENSIHVRKIGKNEYFISIECPYAIFLEYGTRYIDVGSVNVPKPVISGSGKKAFRPFIRPAVWQAYRENPELIKRIFFSK